MKDRIPCPACGQLVGWTRLYSAEDQARARDAPYGVRIEPTGPIELAAHYTKGPVVEPCFGRRD
jgi:hypothetical protein